MMEIEEVDPGVLDLCSRQLKDLSKVVLKEHLTEVDLTANRLAEMDPRILALPKLDRRGRADCSGHVRKACIAASLADNGVCCIDDSDTMQRIGLCAHPMC